MPTCKGLRQELIDCLRMSDCVCKDGKSIKQCLIGDAAKVRREGDGADGVPEKCRQLQRAHILCVRGMLDRTQRLQGFKGY